MRSVARAGAISANSQALAPQIAIPQRSPARPMAKLTICTAAAINPGYL